MGGAQMPSGCRRVSPGPPDSSTAGRTSTRVRRPRCARSLRQVRIRSRHVRLRRDRRQHARGSPTGPTGSRFGSVDDTPADEHSAYRAARYRRASPTGRSAPEEVDTRPSQIQACRRSPRRATSVDSRAGMRRHRRPTKSRILSFLSEVDGGEGGTAPPDRKAQSNQWCVRSALGADCTSRKVPPST